MEHHQAESRSNLVFQGKEQDSRWENWSKSSKLQSNSRARRTRIRCIGNASLNKGIFQGEVLTQSMLSGKDSVITIQLRQRSRKHCSLVCHTLLPLTLYHRQLTVQFSIWKVKIQCQLLQTDKKVRFQASSKNLASQRSRTFSQRTFTSRTLLNSSRQYSSHSVHTQDHVPWRRKDLPMTA